MADKAETKPYSLVPPEGDPKVGTVCMAILAKIIGNKVRLGLHDRWYRNYQLRRNQHWKAQSPQGVPLATANLLFTHIQRTVNIMTDNNPTFNIAAGGQLDENMKSGVMDLQRATEHWWNETEQQDVLESSCLNGEQYGPAIEKVTFSEELEYGLGDVEAMTIDPFHFGWYPVNMAESRNLHKQDAVAHFYAESVRKLREKYPDKADKIKPDKEMLKELYDTDRQEINNPSGKQGSTLVSIATAVKELFNFMSGSGSEEDDEDTLLCEMYVRDKSMVETKDVNESGEVIKISAPKYTGQIRCITFCSGGVVLEDRDNPNINPYIDPELTRQTYLYDKYPFTIVNSVKDTSSAWGLSDFEQLEQLNMEIDKALSQFILEKDRSARKKLINPLDTGVPNDHFTNYVSIINPTSNMTSQGIRWLETPASSIDYEKTVAMFKELFFLVSGTFDLDSAQSKGKDVISYKAIAALIERAATMHRGKIRAYSRLIRERGRMFLSHVMNFYTEDRWITYRDADGKTSAKMINGSSLIMPAKLTVVSGSTMPISRVQQREEAIALAKMKFIDQAELLERLDYSNRDEVIKRTQAGPMGALLNKLTSVGVPQPFLAYVKAIAEADPKKLAAEVKKGNFPSFTQYSQQVMAEMQGQDQADPAKDAEFKKVEAEIQKAMAEAEKIIAERELITEKIMTERVTQEVKMAGMKFDEEHLSMERAKVVNDIEREAAGQHERGVKMGLDMVSAQNNKPGFNVRGIKSDNEEV